jgi:hypothetical protein
VHKKKLLELKEFFRASEEGDASGSGSKLLLISGQFVNINWPYNAKGVS